MKAFLLLEPMVDVTLRRSSDWNQINADDGLSIERDGTAQRKPSRFPTSCNGVESRHYQKFKDQLILVKIILMTTREYKWQWAIIWSIKNCSSGSDTPSSSFGSLINLERWKMNWLLSCWRLLWQSLEWDQLKSFLELIKKVENLFFTDWTPGQEKIQGSCFV